MESLQSTQSYTTVNSLQLASVVMPYKRVTIKIRSLSKAFFKVKFP
uniref:Uncharacterized protein n=1 Tax=Anguilla anguilla TaxID=7936 RepID=A0A0E9RX81_ANGAN